MHWIFLRCIEFFWWICQKLLCKTVKTKSFLPIHWAPLCNDNSGGRFNIFLLFSILLFKIWFLFMGSIFKHEKHCYVVTDYNNSHRDGGTATFLCIGAVQTETAGHSGRTLKTELSWEMGRGNWNSTAAAGSRQEAVDWDGRI